MTYPPPPGPGGQVPPEPIQPYQQPQSFAPETPYGQVQQPYGHDYGYGSPYSQLGYPPPKTTEGLAIGALVVSCVSVLGLCTWGIGAVLGLVGAILGHVAQKRIRANGSQGAGMALAGIIVGWSVFGLGLIIAGFLIVAIILSETSSPSTY
jgi:hypothetical protein